MFDLLRLDIERYVSLRYPNQDPPFLSRPLLFFCRSGIHAVVMQRFSHWLETKGRDLPTLMYWFLKCINCLGGLFFIFWAKIQLSPETDIGPGLWLSPKGGIIFRARGIGNNCTIQQGVTIGMDKRQEVPLIGNNVWIGQEAILFGAIEICDDVTILPGTVVAKSLPAGAVVKGNPCRIISRDTATMARFRH